MSDIAIPTQSNAVETYQQSSIERLERWADQAVAVRKMADAIVNTSFAPQAYRGKPDEATAAILAGAELGFDPMASLRAFDSINGTPAPKAMTLRAVVQARGHEIRVVESTATRCLMEGRRKGDTEWQRVEWNLERAQAMPQYKSNPNWRSNPTAMLVARATSELCRWIAADAVMGMPYSAEEISDSTGIEALPVARKVTAADFVTKAVEHQATIDHITADEALARIKVAEDQADLDEVRRLCEVANLQDERVVEAWKAKHFEIHAGGERHD